MTSNSTSHTTYAPSSSIEDNIVAPMLIRLQPLLPLYHVCGRSTIAFSYSDKQRLGSGPTIPFGNTLLNRPVGMVMLFQGRLLISYDYLSFFLLGFLSLPRKLLLFFVSAKDFPFVKNLYKALEMQLLSKVTFHTYLVASLFYLVVVGRGDFFLGYRQSFYGRDNQEEKCEDIEKKCFTFQMELVDLRGKNKLIEALQDEAKAHDSPST